MLICDSRSSASRSSVSSAGATFSGGSALCASAVITPSLTSTRPPVIRYSSICPSAVRIVNKPGTNEVRSEEHTSELQSHLNLVCRLLLEKKKNNQTNSHLTAPRQPHALQPTST